MPASADRSLPSINDSMRLPFFLLLRQFLLPRPYRLAPSRPSYQMQYDLLEIIQSGRRAIYAAHDGFLFFGSFREAFLD
jgi:hypothetical protein